MPDRFGQQAAVLWYLSRNQFPCTFNLVEVLHRTLRIGEVFQHLVLDGSLGTKEAQAIVGKVKDKIKRYQENRGEIIFTRDTHTKDYLNTNEGKHLPVEHCIAGTEGWRIADGLEIADAVYIDKPSFGYMDWKHYDLEEVEIVGLCTDICVVSNALIIKATYPEINVTVDASCCAGVTPQTHKAALDTMKMCQVNVIGE